MFLFLFSYLLKTDRLNCRSIECDLYIGIAKYFGKTDRDSNLQTSVINNNFDFSVRNFLISFDKRLTDHCIIVISKKNRGES